MRAFWDWAYQYLTLPASTVAQRALEEVPNLVLQVLVHEVEHGRRDLTQASEGEMFQELITTFQRQSSNPGPLDEKHLAEFTRLLSESFALGDGIKVTWGEATIAQHQQRVLMLTGMMQGLRATIDRHEQAITLLQTAQVENLKALVVRRPAVLV